MCKINSPIPIETWCPQMHRLTKIIWRRWLSHGETNLTAKHRRIIIKQQIIGSWRRQNNHQASSSAMESRSFHRQAPGKSWWCLHERSFKRMGSESREEPFWWITHSSSAIVRIRASPSTIKSRVRWSRRQVVSWKKVWTTRLETPSTTSLRRCPLLTKRASHAIGHQAWALKALKPRHHSLGRIEFVLTISQSRPILVWYWPRNGVLTSKRCRPTKHRVHSSQMKSLIKLSNANSLLKQESPSKSSLSHQ